MSFCTSCGTRLDDSIRFCPNCGTFVDGNMNNQTAYNPQASQQPIALNQYVNAYQQPVYNQAPPANTSKKKVWIIAAVSSFVLILTIILIIVFASGKKDNGFAKNNETYKFGYDEQTYATDTLEYYYNENPDKFLECFGKEDLEQMLEEGCDYELYVEGNDVYFILYFPELYNQLQDFGMGLLSAGFSSATATKNPYTNEIETIDFASILLDENVQNAWESYMFAECGGAFQNMIEEIASYIQSQYDIKPYVYFGLFDSEDHLLGEWEVNG